MNKYEDLPVELFSHPTHPAHNLKLVATGGLPFLCDGCKEPGDGPRYTCGCGTCSFRLHTCCALAVEGTTFQQPLFGDNAFVFLQKPPAPVDGRVCDACGEPASGFVYHCVNKDLDVHPCCWSLQPTITIHVQGAQAFELCDEGPRQCAFCGGKKGQRRRDLWAYRWYNNSRYVYLHVACVKKNASRTWDEAYHSRVGSGGGIVQASMPAVEAAVLQSLNERTSSSGFDHIRKIVSAVASIVIAVIFGNPLSMIGTLLGPGGFLRD